MLENQNNQDIKEWKLTHYPQGVWGLESKGMFQYFFLLNGYMILYKSFTPLGLFPGCRMGPMISIP